jgi:hypothetical protein
VTPVSGGIIKLKADHKIIDTFLVLLRENPISPSIFSDFLRPYRRQNHPRTIAKGCTFNIKGLEYSG